MAGILDEIMDELGYKSFFEIWEWMKSMNLMKAFDE
jgi:hypothetical protein